MPSSVYVINNTDFRKRIKYRLPSVGDNEKQSVRRISTLGTRENVAPKRPLGENEYIAFHPT